VPHSTSTSAWNRHWACCYKRRDIAEFTCVSVCLSVTPMSHVETAEPTKVMFGTHPHGTNKPLLDGYAQWHHLTNTIDRFCVR